MSISSLGSMGVDLLTAGSASPARQISPTASLGEDERSAIRDKGLTVWAHDKKMEALKERIRDQLLAEQGLTEKSIDALPSDQRTSVEDEIAKMIEQRLKETMEASVEDAAKTGKTEAVLLDIIA